MINLSVIVRKRISEPQHSKRTHSVLNKINKVKTVFTIADINKKSLATSLYPIIIDVIVKESTINKIVTNEIIRQCAMF